jgi:hypothetical protein
MSHAIQFTNPEVVHFKRNIYNAARLVQDGTLKMVEKDRHKDAPGAVLASTGPSIENQRVLNRIRVLVERRGYTLMALKESIGFLSDMGLPVTYTASMDPGGERQVTRTPLRDGVTYCLASSCHPDLYDHVQSAPNAKVEVFHSACGYTEPLIERGAIIPITDGGEVYCIHQHDLVLKTNEGLDICPILHALNGEVEIYEREFGTRDVMCGGFALVNRALALLQYMGFSKVVIAGADFGWRDKNHDTHYASFVEVGPVDGGYMQDEGRVDGKVWHTRPDQLASAADIAKKKLDGQVEIVGDSLAASLAKRGRAFCESVVRIEG